MVQEIGVRNDLQSTGSQSPWQSDGVLKWQGGTSNAVLLPQACYQVLIINAALILRHALLPLMGKPSKSILTCACASPAYLRLTLPRGRNIGWGDLLSVRRCSSLFLGATLLVVRLVCGCLICRPGSL